ncbi:MAG: FG-GAP repeat protein, partial [Candidatus Sulfotelmatobacter sp.]
MFSKRVPLLLAVLAAALVYEVCPDCAVAQNLGKNSNLHANSAGHVSTSSRSQLLLSRRLVSPRPITPGEKALATALKSKNPRYMTPGQPTSSTDIFRAAITTPSGGQETYAGATGDLNGDGKLDVVLASQCATNNCSNGVVS